MMNQPPRSIPQPEGPNSSISAGFDNLILAQAEGEAYLALPEVIQHRPQPARGDQSWRWLMIALLSCVATSTAAVGAFLWLVNLPPTANCDNAATVTTDRAQLYCAQIAAESGELADILTSLDLLGGWTTEHPLYYEVQPLVAQWSTVVLKAAEQELRQGNLAAAKELIGRIPASSPVHGAGQAALADWNAEWAQGTELIAKAETALQQKDWATASAQVLALAELQNPHWRVDQVQAVARQIRQERQAMALLDQAVAIATAGGRDRLGAAIRTASQIDDTTFTQAVAQGYLDRWSDLLLKQGLDDWYASNLEAAIALGRYVSLNPNRAQAAQELIWLSQARQLAQTSLGTWRTSPDQLISLYRAMLLANRIPADSRYYPQAQSSVATWRTHLDDLGQLQTAQMVGRFRQLDTLKLAIGQAEQIPLGHPRRVQAQTMMAHWRLEVERLEDRPYLVKAHQLAQAKTIDGLRSAIESAQAITLNRALRAEAQSWIYVWTNQIQAIEDRPILNRAQGLAERGELSQAIAEASTVKTGRALYDEAQAAIGGWRRQIWAQEQARRRAVQRALAASQAPEPTETSLPAMVDPNQEVDPAPVPETPLGLEGRPPALISPLPMPQPVRRSPRLPDRIETIPGPAVAPTGNAPAPVVTPAVEPTMPAASGSEGALPRPPAPPLPAGAEPTPAPTLAPPSPSPTPVAPVESSAPGLEDNTQGYLTTPGPAISVQPRPERTLSLKTRQDAEVLYTGALYAGW